MEIRFDLAESVGAEAPPTTDCVSAKFFVGGASAPTLSAQIAATTTTTQTSPSSNQPSPVPRV
ncbi:DUF6053 domain-containing protein [Lysobacter gummosus]|uniref:DUF6053 domain-containing protein n=1 Tax=Lysobacter TaxID=68 RepID=UPI003CCE0B1B